MTNGTFAFVYGEPKGVGSGYIVIRDGSVFAKDTGGWETRARLSPSPMPDHLTIEGTTSIPAGTWNVAGSSPHDVNMSKDFKAVIPKNFGNGDPFEWRTPSGPVTAMAAAAGEDDPSRFERALRALFANS